MLRLVLRGQRCIRYEVCGKNTSRQMGSTLIPDKCRAQRANDDRYILNVGHVPASTRSRGPSWSRHLATIDGVLSTPLT